MVPSLKIDVNFLSSFDRLHCIHRRTLLVQLYTSTDIQVSCYFYIRIYFPPSVSNYAIMYVSKDRHYSYNINLLPGRTDLSSEELDHNHKYSLLSVAQYCLR